MARISTLISLTIAAAATTLASDACATPEPPIVDRYRLAERFMAENRDKYVVNGQITPHWIGREDRFWYMRIADDGAKVFVVVDASTGIRAPAFDHARIAVGLAKAAGTPVDPRNLPFDEFSFAEAGTRLTIDIEQRRFSCVVASGDCTLTGDIPAQSVEVLSPDGKWIAYKKDYNFWLRPAAGNAPAFALTTDGAQHYAYGEPSGQNNSFVSDQIARVNQQPLMSWSPDSRKILTHRMDVRLVNDFHIIQHVPDGGKTHPKLWTFRAAAGRDTHWPISMPVIIDVSSRTIVPVKLKPVQDDDRSNIELQLVWWAPDGKSVYFIEREPYYKALHLNRVDPLTGVAKRLITEKADKTFVYIAEDGGWPKVRITAAGDIVWYSERSGYGHLYKYDANGRLKCALTSGAWMVRDIVRYDEANNRLFFVGSGRDSKLDPYFLSLYSADLGCRGIRQLTPEDANHVIRVTERNVAHYERAQGSMPFTETNSLSASNKYIVDTFSRPDMPPTTVLRRSDGSVISSLERADISKLSAGGFTMPEPFRVLADDGRTWLYGTLFKPSYFDPNKKYPVINAVYLGPQTTRVVKDFVLSAFDWNTTATQAYAELGFIVVALDPRGGPFRSKVELDYSYGKMFSGSGNLIDEVNGIKSLAATRPYMDITKVGINGYSSGGYASARAMLMFPDFYKVAVSAAGAHNPYSYNPWMTTYTGPDPDGSVTAALSNIPLAGKLKGKLLLIQGEMDDNVHPFMAMEFIDALMKAQKPFDFLLVPNANHGGIDKIPYVAKRTWDYFVTNLRDEIPPEIVPMYSPK